MSKPQKAEKIHPNLQRVIEECERHQALDTVIQGVVRFAQDSNYHTLLAEFERNYHGFTPVASGEITVFEGKVRYISEMSKHPEVIELRLPTEYDHP